MYNRLISLSAEIFRGLIYCIIFFFLIQVFFGGAL